MSIYFAISVCLGIWVLISYKTTPILREGTLYLLRTTILSCPLFSIKIHKMYKSDPEEPHDHPWNYLSIILRGGYSEEKRISHAEFKELNQAQKQALKEEYKFYGVTADALCFTKWFKPGSILFRNGRWLHRLILPKGKTCTTIVFTSRKWRKWGFIDRQGKYHTHNEDEEKNFTYCTPLIEEEHKELNSL